MSHRTGREVWSSRTVFLAAAIGSAIGLGNIWRFPYIAYENGGGSFLIPYVIALITGGVSMLFFDYAIGHRFRGAPPLALRRISRHAEVLGWVQCLVTFFLAVYYMAILAWSAFYAYYSLTLAWGEDPEDFFIHQFLQLDDGHAYSGNYLPGLTIVLALIWIGLLLVMSLGVEGGVGKVSKFAVPILIVFFIMITIRALMLPGATLGLQTLFTPDWSALAKPSVWMAGYGQIFYSLAVGCGIMLTQASYLKRRTDITTTAWTVAFANSAFEVMAGIGVFSVLGYMAMNAHQEVGDVVSSGIGMAFIAFPKIISLMPGGVIFGAFFFGSLFLAGFTSMFSIIEVPISSAMDKFGWGRRKAVLLVGGSAAIISVAFFPTTTGLPALDIMDKFVNVFGLVLIGLVTLLVVGWGMKMFPVFSRHLDAISTIRTRGWWIVAVGIVTPGALIVTLSGDLWGLITSPYGGYSFLQLLLYGWGMTAIMWGGAFVLSRMKWAPGTDFRAPAEYNFDLDEQGRGVEYANAHEYEEHEQEAHWARKLAPGDGAPEEV